MSEFAAIFCFMFVVFNKEKSKSRVLITIVLVALFSPILYHLSDIYVLGYFWLSLILKIVEFKFLDYKTQTNSVEVYIKNAILITFAGIIGLGKLSIFVYYIFKTIDDTLMIFGKELIRFKARK